MAGEMSYQRVPPQPAISSRIPEPRRTDRHSRQPLRRIARWLILAAVCSLVASASQAADPPRPVLRSIYPAGGQAGTTVLVAIDGAALDGPAFDSLQAAAATGGPAAAAPRLWFADSRISAVARGPKTFEVTLPANLPCHRLDVRVVGRHGISGPRAFQITPARDRLEQEPNDLPPQATAVGTIDGTINDAIDRGSGSAINGDSQGTIHETSTGNATGTPAATDLTAAAIVLNGRLEKAADIDSYRVALRAGQTVVCELWADRLDSPLRGALEIFDAAGRRLVSDRGRLGSVDPRIDFIVPADGSYTVRVFDQTYLGGADYVYRLAVDAGPRVDFATPAFASHAGARSAATLWGRNLDRAAVAPARPPQSGSAKSLERFEAEVDLAPSQVDWPPLRPAREAFVDALAARWSTGLQPFTQAFSQPPREPFPLIHTEFRSTETDSSRAMPTTLPQVPTAAPAHTSPATTPPSDTPPSGAPPSNAIGASTPARDRYAANKAAANEAPPSTLPASVTPLIEDGDSNHSAAMARTVSAPVDLAGRLGGADERDWYAFEARRGEVFWLEGFAERLGAPVDLELFVFDSDGRELLQLTDQPRNPLGTRFPTDTTDPAGRFTAPRDGSYFLVASNAIGGAAADARRRYAVTFRREEFDFRLVVVPRAADAGAGLRAARGGREPLDLLVQRRNGFTGPVRIRTEHLPAGWSCDDSWIGANEDRGLLVVTAPATGAPELAQPRWLGVATIVGRDLQREAVTGAATRVGDPRGVARTTHGAPIASVGEAPLFVEAAVETPLASHQAAVAAANAGFAEEAAARLPLLYQDSVVEVRVDVRRSAGADGPIELRAIGLPRGVRADFVTIPASDNRGWLTLSVARDQLDGPFSFAIQADLLPPEPATRPTGAATSRRTPKTPVSTTVSNLLSARVAPGRIQMAIDPRTPRKIARGEVIHVRYSAERRHGFIGKIHTELAAPGGVRGIRGRGVTFTSQTETGEIQIIATENAPLGPITGLRLEAIGTVEDQPTYLGGCLLDLEIIE